MAYDIERLTQTGETKEPLLDPEEIAARNNGYNEYLYGNLTDGTSKPAGSPETPGDQDESREFFGEATVIATENNDTLDADKEHPNGFKTVKVEYGGQEFTIRRAEDWYMEEHPETPRVAIEFPPMPIDYLGVTGTHHVKLIESAPDTWECVIKNDITSGREQDLPPEYRNMQRPLSLHETHIKHSILSHPELIDPEDQKNLRRVADPYAELTSPEEAA
jgi:hypothetical protein